MGYTHYYDLHTDKISEKALYQIEDTINNYRDFVQREFDDNSYPTVEQDKIILNGVGDDGYETFYLQEGSGFCKTNMKPYDIVVCEILLILKHHLNNKFKLSSDGFWVSREEMVRKELCGNWSEALSNIGERFELEFELIPIMDGDYYCFEIEPK